MLKRSVVGLGLMLALSLFLTIAAYANPYFGPQTYQVDKYYYFGDATFAEKSRQGLDISVDPSSVSYQSVKATVTMDYNIITDRQITKFIVLANGVNVDEFEPYFDTAVSSPVYKEYYYLDVNVSDQYIGSDVYFQVVGLKQDQYLGGSNNVFVVAWSQESPTVKLKPLPVTDVDTHGLLAAILDILEQLKATLEGKLDALTKAVEDIYTPSPAAQVRFDSALESIQSKLPTEQMMSETENITNALDNSLMQLNPTNPEKITLGGKVRFIPELAESEFYILDLTEFRDIVNTIRKILEAMLWILFLNGLLNRLMPRPNI